MKQRLHLIIKGDVQGVFFRVYTKKKADQLNLTGWVKNNFDGNVEAVFEGEDNKLKQVIEFCRIGPPAATVEEVKDDWNKCRDEFEDFRIIY